MGTHPVVILLRETRFHYFLNWFKGSKNGSQMKCMIITTSSTNCKVTSKEASPLLQNCEPITAVGFEPNVVMNAQRRVSVW